MFDAIDLAQDRFAALGTLEGAYFRYLADESAGIEGFRRSQIQFAFAVKAFPRALAYLAARIPESAARLALVRNLWEEHGEGDPCGFHVYTFDSFLRRIGARPAEIDGAVPGPAVGAFNAALLGLAAAEPVAAAAAALGMIELMFSSISARLAHLAIARGWIERARMLHYDVHSELDVEHAAELFEIVQADGRTPEGRALIERGIEVGGHVFDRLYEELAREARREAAPVGAERMACA